MDTPSCACWSDEEKRGQREGLCGDLYEATCQMAIMNLQMQGVCAEATPYVLSNMLLGAAFAACILQCKTEDEADELTDSKRNDKVIAMIDKMCAMIKERLENHREEGETLQ